MGISVFVAGPIVAIAVFLAMYLLADKLIHRKAARDQRQFEASKAAGVADLLKLGKFGDLLRWYAVGSIKQTLLILQTLFVEYCQDQRGPYRLARDVFMASWGMLRSDPEFGPECREKVVAEALGVEINDDSDLQIIRVADRCKNIGWPTLAQAGEYWATRKWFKFTTAIRALFMELLQDDGEIAIAKRVAPKTFEALWNSKVDGARATAEAIVVAKAKELGWTPPTVV